MKMTKGWTPIRKGRYYCSPACGGKCTHKDYRIAKEEAASAVKLLGPKWKSRVWENLGWHWEVTQGKVQIFKGGIVRSADYHCIINFDSPNFSYSSCSNDLQSLAVDAATFLIEAGTSITNEGRSLILGTNLAKGPSRKIWS